MKKIPRKYFYNHEVQDGENEIGCTFDELENPTYTPDIAFVKYFIEEVGVALIPLSSFFGAVNTEDIKKTVGL